MYVGNFATDKKLIPRDDIRNYVRNHG